MVAFWFTKRLSFTLCVCYSVCVCVHACVRACGRACVHACMQWREDRFLVRVFMGVCACLHTCVYMCVCLCVCLWVCVHVYAPVFQESYGDLYRGHYNASKHNFTGKIACIFSVRFLIKNIIDHLHSVVINCFLQTYNDCSYHQTVQFTAISIDWPGMLQEHKNTKMAVFICLETCFRWRWIWAWFSHMEVLLLHHFTWLDCHLRECNANLCNIIGKHLLFMLLFVFCIKSKCWWFFRKFTSSATFL